MKVMLAVFSAAFLLVTTMAQNQAAPQADVIYVHANIYTGTTGSSSFHEVQRAQAMALSGDRVLAVGAEADVLKLKGPGTSVVDLHGRFVMPGFNDAHIHLTEAGFQKLRVDLTGVRSLEEFRERIRQRVRTAGPTEWILGSGWDETLWQVKDLPSRWDLDEVTTDHPAYLDRTDGHVAVANTLALKMARVTLATKDPEGGEIGRDISGQPNGILRETARDLVTAIIPPPTADKQREATETALQEIAQAGITSVQDNSDAENGEAYWNDFQIFEQLEREGKLTVRISEWLPFNAPLEILKARRAAHPQSDAMLRTGMLKGFMDGSLGSHTAAMLQPYADDPKNSGLPRYEQEQLNSMTKERLQAGFQLGFHAIGDKAVEMALEAFAEAEKAVELQNPRPVSPNNGETRTGHPQNSGPDFRHRIEHVQVSNPAQVARFRQLKVIASMQPSHLLTDMHWVNARLGPARAAHSYAWAEFVNYGVTVAFGSDDPFGPLPPLLGLYAATTRKSEDGKMEFHPEQKLTIEQAIAAYTTGAAFAEFAEKQKGTLAPGMLADFVVLDQDVTAIPPEQILRTHVLQTVVGGKTVSEMK
jgi:predicted amidohydrolase YtcJ